MAYEEICVFCGAKLGACCEDCGKYEFYKYETACKNPHTAYLIDCDTQKG